MAEFTVFRDSIKNVSPPWLQGFWGYRFMYSVGIQLDGVAETLRQGVLARMPGYGTTEALPYSGNDRQILRGVNESDESFISRVQNALTTWSTAGNSLSIVSQLLGYVSPAVPKIRYVVEGVDELSNPIADWVTVEAGVVTFFRASPRNWDWDGGAPNWRFWIIIYPGFTPFDTRKTWGDGHFYGDGTAWGYDGAPSLVTDMRSMVSKWKAAGSECLFIVSAADNADFDPSGAPGYPLPDGTWDNPANRLPTALYFSGVL